MKEAKVGMIALPAHGFAAGEVGVGYDTSITKPVVRFRSDRVSIEGSSAVTVPHKDGSIDWKGLEAALKDSDSDEPIVVVFRSTHTVGDLVKLYEFAARTPWETW
jgi:hypothetical protein